MCFKVGKGDGMGRRAGKNGENFYRRMNGRKSSVERKLRAMFHSHCLYVGHTTNIVNVKGGCALQNANDGGQFPLCPFTSSLLLPIFPIVASSAPSPTFGSSPVRPPTISPKCPQSSQQQRQVSGAPSCPRGRPPADHQAHP